jgi:hypothetical protein
LISLIATVAASGFRLAVRVPFGEPVSSSRLQSDNHLLFWSENFGVLCIPLRDAPYSRDSVSLLIFLIAMSHASGLLTLLPISLLRICHQSAGVAINQPHGIHHITLVSMMFWLLSPFTVSGWGYLFPGPATSPRYSSVKRTFGIPSHFPLGICHQLPGFRYTPSE